MEKLTNYVLNIEIMNMKRIYRCKLLIVLMLILGMSCEDKSLENFKFNHVESVEVSLDNVAGEIKKSNGKITIPLRVSLSKPAAQAFQVGLKLNTDTVVDLLSKGLMVNTVGLAANEITLPNVVRVPYGATTASFEVSYDIITLEQHYGKKIAFALNLIEPGKGNKIGKQGSNLITLDTHELLDISDIHYLTFTYSKGGRIEVKNDENYVMTSSGLTIPIGISLGGVPALPFTIETEITQDSIMNLMDQGKLPYNTIILNPDKYFLDKTVEVEGNTSNKAYELSIPSAVINENKDKVLAFSITMTKASRHVIDPKYRHVLVLVYPSLIQGL